MPTITRRTYTPGWDAGARSVAYFSGDGCAYWQVRQAIGIVCGFNDHDDSPGFTEIDHAFYIASGKYRIIENGVYKTSPASYAADAVFKVERIKGVVYYLVDNVLVYTSLNPSEGIIFVDCSLYYYLDTIVCLEIEDYSLVEPTVRSSVFDANFATIEGEFQSITGYLVESGIEFVRGSFEELTGQLVMAESAYLRGSFAPIVGILLEDGVEILRGSFEEITGQLNEVHIIPEYNAIFGVFEPMYGKLFEYADSNIIQGSFEPMVGKLIEGDVAVLSGSFESITGTLWSSLQNQMVLVWPQWRFSLDEWADDTQRGYAIFDWPAFTGEVVATTGDNTALFQWPAFTGESYSGARCEFDWPAFTGSSTATNPGFATVLFDWPAFEGESTGFVGQLGGTVFTWPVFTGESYGGASVDFPWPSFEGESEATVGSVATVLFDWPAFIGEASGTVGHFGSALFEWPAFEGSAGDGVHVLFDWPAFTGAATATHAVVAADAETYVINLTTGAVTRLLLGPLDKLVTAYGKLYVLRDGELLVLAGENDGLDGDDPIPIPATVRFAQQNFGSYTSKRCPVVYLNAREDDGLTLDIVADERTTWRYQTSTDTAPALGTHRVKTGRGVKFHTLGVVVQNRDGGRLDIGGIELLVQQLTPRPKT